MWIHCRLDCRKIGSDLEGTVLSISGVARNPKQGRGLHARNILQMLAKGDAAKSEIVASWDRCIKLHKLDPERDRNQMVVTQMELRDAAGCIQPCLRSAEREIDGLARQMAKLGFFLSIANADGVAVIHRGNIPDLGDHKAKVQDGMCWGESAQGTNAIGTGLYAGRPTIVYQDEHFYESNTGMTCLAVPLFGPAGELIGALNTASLDPNIGRCLTSVLQWLLVAAAQRMEALWFRESYPGALIIALSEAGKGTGSSPLLAVDPDLNVLGATNAARSHCRITPEALATGLHLDQIDPVSSVGAPSLWDAERAALKRALALSGQNVSLAASHLGISRATMYRKMTAYSLSRQPRAASRRAPDAQT
jgi:transcriptional regulator of acetoin/glycerol metabolism